MADGTVARAFFYRDRVSRGFIFSLASTGRRRAGCRRPPHKNTQWAPSKTPWRHGFISQTRSPRAGVWPQWVSLTHVHASAVAHKQKSADAKKHRRQLNQARVFNEIQQERWLVDGTFVPECNRAGCVELVKHSVANASRENTENSSQISVDGTSLHLLICH